MRPADEAAGSVEAATGHAAGLARWPTSWEHRESQHRHQATHLADHELLLE